MSMADSTPPPAPPPPPAPIKERPPGPATVEHFVQQIKETADKLLRDGITRADAKLLATAVRELRYAFKVFKPFVHTPKVTVFGSARVPPTHPSYQQAVAFSRVMAQAGYMIVTGAASGIMEAGHVGAGVANSIGVNIILPFEQAANYVIRNDSKLAHLKYFFTRKLMLVKESQAMAVFPGGFGTHDEAFEVLTLMQTGKMPIIPVVFLEEPGGTYWKAWAQFVKDVLLVNNYICPADLSLYLISESVDEAANEILGFYRVYHSMRYVHDHLVLRLKAPVPAELLGRIRGEFRDLLVHGDFELIPGALPAEQGEQHLIHLPRLRFAFNKRNAGRLRELINFLNAHVPVSA